MLGAWTYTDRTDKDGFLSTCLASQQRSLINVVLVITFTLLGSFHPNPSQRFRFVRLSVHFLARPLVLLLEQFLSLYRFKQTPTPSPSASSSSASNRISYILLSFIFSLSYPSRIFPFSYSSRSFFFLFLMMTMTSINASY